MKIVSFGGGVNSTAMLVGMADRLSMADAIVFSDTGGELPHTYRHVNDMSLWLKNRGYPEIIVIRNSGETLEENCLRRKALPAIAFGFKTCSLRWKAEPFDKWANHYVPAIKAWEREEKIEKCIGFDADEQHRVRLFEDKKWITRYPLIEWGWDRDECIEQIKRAGIVPPEKSSCFFCPNRTASEYRQMQSTYPEHLRRAIAMEENAELTSIKGLKRDYSLTQLLAQKDLFGYDAELPCGCVE